MSGLTETVTKIDPKLETGWKNALQLEFDKPYMSTLKAFLLQEKTKGAVVFPPGNQIFSAGKRRVL